MNCLLLLLAWLSAVTAFSPSAVTTWASSSALSAQSDAKVAVDVSGKELEQMLENMEEPIVVDAFATWCGPCTLMTPEFEAAAKELQGRVRFAKVDTDRNKAVAKKFRIMGLPTVLFLDKADGGGSDPAAALKGRVEGTMKKQNIIDLCEFYFFGGPRPSM